MPGLPSHHPHTLAPDPGPYVAELFSSFEDPACVYLIMEYCEGGDLFKTMLMHGGVLEEQWVCVEVHEGSGQGQTAITRRTSHRGVDVQGRLRL